MNPRIIKVEPLEEYKLKLHFTNNEVKVFMGSITWPNGQDFCPDTLYEESIKIN